jgi:hypothetical protein
MGAFARRPAQGRGRSVRWSQLYHLLNELEQLDQPGIHRVCERIQLTEGQADRGGALPPTA